MLSLDSWLEWYKHIMFCEICKCFVDYLRTIFIISLALACKMRYTIKENRSYNIFGGKAHE